MFRGGAEPVSRDNVELTRMPGWLERTRPTQAGLGNSGFSFVTRSR